jgi:hypothetical protein
MNLIRRMAALSFLSCALTFSVRAHSHEDDEDAVAATPNKQAAAGRQIRQLIQQADETLAKLEKSPQTGQLLQQRFLGVESLKPYVGEGELAAISQRGEDLLASFLKKYPDYLPAYEAQLYALNLHRAPPEAQLPVAKKCLSLGTSKSCRRMYDSLKTNWTAPRCTSPNHELEFLLGHVTKKSEPQVGLIRTQRRKYLVQGRPLISAEDILNISPNRPSSNRPSSTSFDFELKPEAAARMSKIGKHGFFPGLGPDQEGDPYVLVRLGDQVIIEVPVVPNAGSYGQNFTLSFGKDTALKFTQLCNGVESRAFPPEFEL